MTAQPRPMPSACPACVAGPMAQGVAAGAPAKDGRILLSLPEIHCAGCIAGVERALAGDARCAGGARQPDPETRQRHRRIGHRGGRSGQAADRRPAIPRTNLTPHRWRAQTDPPAANLLMRLGVAGFAMMNVMLLSVAVWSGATDATRDLFHWISATIAIPTIAFSAQPFFRNAAGGPAPRAAEHGRADLAGDPAGGGHVGL